MREEKSHERCKTLVKMWIWRGGKVKIKIRVLEKHLNEANKMVNDTPNWNQDSVSSTYLGLKSDPENEKVKKNIRWGGGKKT